MKAVVDHAAIAYATAHKHNTLVERNDCHSWVAALLTVGGLGILVRCLKMAAIEGLTACSADRLAVAIELTSSFALGCQRCGASLFSALLHRQMCCS